MSTKFQERLLLFVSLRRRDAGYPAPPAQSRTCSFPASGSSVVLAFARIFTVARYKTQLLFPAVRLARILRSYVSGASFLCGLRTPVGSFAMWLAFPTSDYYAR